jgi:hypothetical protein
MDEQALPERRGFRQKGLTATHEQALPERRGFRQKGVTATHEQALRIKYFLARQKKPLTNGYVHSLMALIQSIGKYRILRLYTHLIARHKR